MSHKNESHLLCPIVSFHTSNGVRDSETSLIQTSLIRTTGLFAHYDLDDEARCSKRTVQKKQRPKQVHSLNTVPIILSM
jgi:hypothetical protein